VLASLGLNGRQEEALLVARQGRRMTNARCQELALEIQGAVRTECLVAFIRIADGLADDAGGCKSVVRAVVGMPVHPGVTARQHRTRPRTGPAVGAAGAHAGVSSKKAF
jgi:hypothetical protein